MMIWMLRFVLIIMMLTPLICTEEVVVRLSHGGKVRGLVLTSEKGKAFYAFRGIPYAEPPVGELRFKTPLDKAAWTDEVDATKDGPICFQGVYLVNESMSGQEDCLYLNVYSPQLPTNGKNSSKKAVMVYIHGGGLQFGDGRSVSYPPHRLMDSEIILVTINYRLGTLGFLSTGDEYSRGNYGLHDQVLAFQWVKYNIETFGGDPDSVTIFGESSGGVSVSYHLISSLSKGLFHKAIIMSGSSLCAYAFESEPLSWAKRLASQTDCPQQPTSAMVECFRSKPLKDLLFNMGDSVSITPFPPTVDGIFLLTPPGEVLKNSPDEINNVTVLSGCTELEAVAIITWMRESKPNDSISSEEVFDILFNNSISNYDASIIRKIRDRYLKSIDVTNEFETNKAVAKAYSDGSVLMSHFAEIQLLAQAGLSVYSYSYDYTAVNADEDTKRYGVGHEQDLYVLFNISSLSFEKNDYKMVNIMTEVWSNFAKTGNPDPAHKYLPGWKPSTSESIYIHHLNLSITIEDYDVNNDEIFTFWTQDIVIARNNTNYG